MADDEHDQEAAAALAKAVNDVVADEEMPSKDDVSELKNASLKMATLLHDIADELTKLTARVDALEVETKRIHKMYG